MPSPHATGRHAPRAERLPRARVHPDLVPDARTVIADEGQRGAVA